MEGQSPLNVEMLMQLDVKMSKILSETSLDASMAICWPVKPKISSGSY